MLNPRLGGLFTETGCTCIAALELLYIFPLEPRRYRPVRLLAQVRIMTSSSLSRSWKEEASAKRASILAHIPEKWRLTASDLERAAKQRDMTGAFIQDFLDQEAVTIVTKSSVAIVSSLQKRELSAVRVTTAFCQASAIAQQIVSECGTTNIR